MKKVFILIGFILIGFACKKKNNEEVPEPQPVVVQKGEISLTVQAYDSLGKLLPNFYGQKVKLDASHSAITDSLGKVHFSDLPYGDYYPSLVKDFWEAPPITITLAESAKNSVVPIAQIAPWKAQSLSALAIKPDSIIVNFKLDRPVPAGQQVKMALIASKDNSLSGNNFKSVDVFFTSTDNVNQLNIAKFARFKNMVEGLDSADVFYIKVLPVSYGEFTSNLLGKSLLLGDNLFPPDNWLLKKEWK